MPVLRLGRYVGLKGPGIIYLVPLIDRAPLKISTRLDTIQFRTESTLTKDNVPVNVDSVLYMKPVDLEKAVLQLKTTIKLLNWLRKQPCEKSSAK
jgi:regulator of protease activity HflC (stomatin/prohibitin superfamily)